LNIFINITIVNLNEKQKVVGGALPHVMCIAEGMRFFWEPAENHSSTSLCHSLVLANYYAALNTSCKPTARPTPAFKK
jgi:hypothetical protein